MILGPPDIRDSLSRYKSAMMRGDWLKFVRAAAMNRQTLPSSKSLAGILCWRWRSVE